LDFFFLAYVHIPETNFRLSFSLSLKTLLVFFLSLKKQKFPCDSNVISVSLSPSAALPILCTPCLTLTGLLGSLSETNPEMLLSGTDSSLFGGKGEWTQSSGELVVCAAKDLPAQAATFSFILINPERSESRDREIGLHVSADVTVPAQSSPARPKSCQSSKIVMDACSGAAPSHVYQACDSADLKECWPLNVRGLVFEVKRIGQATPHSGCTNSIIVTLRTNVPLIVSEQCQPKLTISGLSGAQMIDPASAQVPLTAQPGQCEVGALSAFLFRSDATELSGFGKWVDSDNTLELWSAQRSQAGQTYIFSFQIKNPVAPQSAPASLSIRSLNGMFDGRKGLPSYQAMQDVTGGVAPADEAAVCFLSTNSMAAVDMSLPEEAPCCLCAVEAGDAKPMAVKSPSFCMKRICQTSADPCANNTITITISPTMVCTIRASHVHTRTPCRESKRARKRTSLTTVVVSMWMGCTD